LVNRNITLYALFYYVYTDVICIKLSIIELYYKNKYCNFYPISVYFYEIIEWTKGKLLKLNPARVFQPMTRKSCVTVGIMKLFSTYFIYFIYKNTITINKI